MLVFSFDIGYRNLGAAIAQITPVRVASSSTATIIFDYRLELVSTFDLSAYVEKLFRQKGCSQASHSFFPKCKLVPAWSDAQGTRALCKKHYEAAPPSVQKTFTTLKKHTAQLHYLVQGLKACGLLTEMERLLFETYPLEKDIHFVLELQPRGHKINNSKMQAVQAMLHTLLANQFQEKLQASDRSVTYYQFPAASKFSICIEDYLSEATARSRQLEKQQEGGAGAGISNATAEGGVIDDKKKKKQPRATAKVQKRLTNKQASALDYDIRKSFATVMTKQILNTDTHATLFNVARNQTDSDKQKRIVAAFTTLAKTDDAADALLQLLSYAQHQCAGLLTLVEDATEEHDNEDEDDTGN